MSAAKITAQVACEYIANHPDDGWDESTLVAVMGHALANDVALFYVAGVREVLAAHRERTEAVEL